MPAAATAAGGHVTLVSHTGASPITTGNDQSGSARVSANGRFVVFSSFATNLVPGQVDGPDTEDVFLFDRFGGSLTLVSHAVGSVNATANDVSVVPGSRQAIAISADGAFVAFLSEATNLVAGQVDSPGSIDLFLYARSTGTNTLITHVAGSETTAADSLTLEPSMSADGRFVAYDSGSSNLVAGQSDTNGERDIFIFDRLTATNTLVSHRVGSEATAGDENSIEPLISSDGSSVAFWSGAADLVAGQNDPVRGYDVFLYRRATGVITLVSHRAGTSTAAGDADSFDPVLSADGSLVAYHSLATDLVASSNDVNATTDVFLYDAASGNNELVSHSVLGATTAANEQSDSPEISADGSFVVFQSVGSDLVVGQVDPTPSTDVFLFARAGGAVTLVSRTTASPATTANGSGGLISADGTSIVFHAEASNMIPGQLDTNDIPDAFLLQRATGTITLLSHIPTSSITAANKGAGVVAVSDNGSVVVLESGSTNLVTGQVDPVGGGEHPTYSNDVFVFEPAAPLSVPADFNGDRKTDLAVFRPSTGAWLIRNQSSVFLGASGDIPVPCDYNGDGTTDIAVFRPGVGGWYVNGQAPVFFGLNGDIPVPGDYNGDGHCDVAIFRPSVGGWYVQGQSTVFYGLSGDIPVPEDYNGDGTSDVAVFRPSVGGWYRNGAATTFFGLSGDVPVPGDYDANATTDIAIYRPSVGGWYVNGQSPQFLGLSSDIPQPGDYDGNGSTDLAVYRPATGAWYVGAQPPVFFGTTSDLPLPLPSAIRMAGSG